MRYNLQELPSLPFVRRSELPTCRGIYFAAIDGEVFYVGRTQNLRARWKNHDHTEGLLNLSSTRELRIFWSVVRMRDFYRAERDAIVQFDPAFNIKRPSRVSVPKPARRISTIASRTINIVLRGEHLEQFERYKSRQFLSKDSETGRKLILERMKELGL